LNQDKCSDGRMCQSKTPAGYSCGPCGRFYNDDGLYQCKLNIQWIYAIVIFLIIIGVAVGILLWRRFISYDLDLPNTWFWDLSIITGEGYLPSNTSPYYEVKTGTRVFEYLKELTEKLDFEGIRYSKAYAVCAIELAISFNTKRNFIKSRKRSNPEKFNKNWEKITDHEKRRKVIQHFKQTVATWIWNENTKEEPILAVVYGTDMENGRKIASGGFAARLTIEQGFYGKGMYFCSSANYALPYALNDGNNEEPAILICFVLPGNPYPVIENPESKNSLIGKTLEQGFQSHYVVTNIEGKPFTDYKKKNVQSYNEIVISHESQVVPLFLLEIDQKTSPAVLEHVRVMSRKFPSRTQKRETSRPPINQDDDYVYVEMDSK